MKNTLRRISFISVCSLTWIMPFAANAQSAPPKLTTCEVKSELDETKRESGIQIGLVIDFHINAQDKDEYSENPTALALQRNAVITLDSVPTTNADLAFELQETGLGFKFATGVSVKQAVNYPTTESALGKSWYVYLWNGVNWGDAYANIPADINKSISDGAIVGFSYTKSAKKNTKEGKPRIFQDCSDDNSTGAK